LGKRPTIADGIRKIRIPGAVDINEKRTGTPATKPPVDLVVQPVMRLTAARHPRRANQDQRPRRLKVSAPLLPPVSHGGSLDVEVSIDDERTTVRVWKDHSVERVGEPSSTHRTVAVALPVGDEDPEWLCFF
jgi:hypothetical protein